MKPKQLQINPFIFLFSQKEEFIYMVWYNKKMSPLNKKGASKKHARLLRNESK